MYGPILTLHSLTRWAVLILLVLAIVQSWQAWKGNQPWTPKHKKISLFAMIAVDIQLLLGLILYLGVSPIVREGFGNMKLAMKVRSIRFWVVEHTILVIIGIVLIHIGFARAKKLQKDGLKHKSIALFYLAGLVAILAAIPWPFLAKIGRPWFRFGF